MDSELVVKQLNGEYKILEENLQPLFIKVWNLEFDFKKVELEESDFVYADPPYDDTFTKYSKGAFGWYDQTRLANWLAKHPGKVVASNNGTDQILELYSNLGFQIELIEVPKKICLSGERKPMMEMLAYKGRT